MRVEYRAGGCSGWVEHEGRRYPFSCSADGRLAMEHATSVPGIVRRELERHCWSNCVPMRWRRRLRGLRGCSCGR